MSIVLRHRFLVRDFLAVPFKTKYGIGFYYFSRNSVLHVHQKFPILSLKRFPYPHIVSSERSKPSQSKSDPVHEKPVQAPSTIKTVQPQNHERELLDGSITVGAAASSQAKPDAMIHEKLSQAPSTIMTVRRQNPKQERFAGSVTMDAAPSPRHVPVPMFCVREKIN